MEADVPLSIAPRLTFVSSSLANRKSETESQSDGRSPKTRAVASPEKAKWVRQFFTYSDVHADKVGVHTIEPDINALPIACYDAKV